MRTAPHKCTRDGSGSFLASRPSHVLTSHHFTSHFLILLAVCSAQLSSVRAEPSLSSSFPFQRLLASLPPSSVCHPFSRCDPHSYTPSRPHHVGNPIPQRWLGTTSASIFKRFYTRISRASAIIRAASICFSRSAMVTQGHLLARPSCQDHYSERERSMLAHCPLQHSSPPATHPHHPS